MLQFEKKMIGKRQWHPFEQYCLSKGIIGHRKVGVISVISPDKWVRMNKTYDLMKWQDEQDMQKLFAAAPEEREAHEAKLEELKRSIRELAPGMKVTD